MEADGVTWHKGRRSQDSERDKALEEAGWDVRRFRTREIQKTAGTYCIAEVEETIRRLGGLDERPLAPQVSYELSADPAQPLAVSEDGPDYDLD